MNTTTSNTPSQKPHSQNKLLGLISILGLAGAIISIWQTRLFYVTRSGMSEMHSFCNIGQTFDCTAIEMSRYSELWSGFPLSVLAIAGYLMILILACFGFIDSFKTHIRKYLVFFCAIAVIFSAIYLAIMLGVIGKLCLLCLTVDAINILLLVFALALAKPDTHQSSGSLSPTQLLGAGAGAALLAFLFSQGVNPQAEVKKEDINDMIESVMNAPVHPELVIPNDSPIVGNPNAPITIVKFSDYQCPSCKLGAHAIHPLMKRYPDQVKFVFVNYPLDQACNPEVKHRMHQFACEAARVAICATAQGKFLPAYETLFEHQTDLKEDKIADLLAEIPGLDLAQVKTCMSLPSTQEKIRTDVELVDTAKIEATPTFFINGKKVEGGLPTSIWIEVIDRILVKQKTGH